MITIGNEELVGRPTYTWGDWVVRESDGAKFELRFATKTSTGEKDLMMAFIKDGDASFLVGIDRRLLKGWKLKEAE